MKKFRLVVASPWTWFVVYEYATNERDAVEKVNKQYAPHFEVLKDQVTEQIL